MPKKRSRGRRGQGTVHQRADGVWCGQISLGVDRITDRRVRETVYGTSREEVEGKLLELRTKWATGTLQRTELTIGGACDWWLVGAGGRIRRTTRDRYRLDIENIKRFLGAVPLAELSTLDVYRFYQQLGNAGQSRDATNKAGVRLRQILKDVERGGLVSGNVAALVPLPRVDRAEQRVLSPEEVQQFLKVARADALYLLFLLALDTGARLGELLALEEGDWDAGRLELRFERALKERGGHVWVEPLKTTASRRRVRLGDTAALAMLEALERPRPVGPEGRRLLIPTERGTYWRASNIHSRHFKPILLAAGLPRNIRIHDLRHTCATLLLLSGVDVATVAARLGHSTPTTTLRTYAHVIPRAAEGAARAMDSYLR